jgi:hypothetical protein
MGANLIATHTASQISNQLAPMTALSKVMAGQPNYQQLEQLMQLQMQHTPGAQFMQPLTDIAAASQTSDTAGLAPVPIAEHIAPHMASQISNQSAPVTDGQLCVGAGGSSTSVSLLRRTRLLEQLKQQLGAELRVLKLQMQHTTGAQSTQPLNGIAAASRSPAMSVDRVSDMGAGSSAALLPVVSDMGDGSSDFASQAISAAGLPSLPVSMASMNALSPGQNAEPTSLGVIFKAMPSHCTGALPLAETNTMDPLLNGIAAASQASSAAGLAPSLPVSMASMNAISPGQNAEPTSLGVIFKAMLSSHCTGALPLAETNTMDRLSVLALCC